MSNSPACRCDHREPGFGRLAQIRMSYAADWYSLRLSVEQEWDSWTVRVQFVGACKPLYEAHRRNMDEAKVAGLEFAIFQVFGTTVQDSPEKLAHVLQWKPQR